MENIETPSPLGNPGKAATPPPQPFTAMGHTGDEHKGDLSGITAASTSTPDIAVMDTQPLLLAWMEHVEEELAKLRDEVAKLKPGYAVGGFKNPNTAG